MWKLTVLALITACAPAHAQDTTFYHNAEVYYEHNDSGEGGYFGSIVHVNQNTPSGPPKPVNVETPYGDVRIVHEVTPNAACPTPGCPDNIEVWTLPDNVVVDQLWIETAEQETGVIRLYWYEGS